MIAILISCYDFYNIKLLKRMKYNMECPLYLRQKLDLSINLKENDIDEVCIYTDKEKNMCIHVSKSYIYGENYFKVYDNCDITKSTKSCRIKISKAKYRKCNDSYREEMKLNHKEIKWLVNILHGKPHNPWCESYDTLWEFIIKELFLMSCSNPITKYGDKKILKYLNKIPNYMNLN